MLNIIPCVKQMKIRDGFLSKKAIDFKDLDVDARIFRAIQMLPYDRSEVKLTVCVHENGGEGYAL